MQIKITDCRDPLMWYSGFVGETFDLIREDEYYWAREPAGFLNIIHKQDADVIDKKTLTQTQE